MKPRILHITAEPLYASEGKQLRLLAQGLPCDQFDLHICTLDGKPGGNCHIGCHGHASVAMSCASDVSPAQSSTAAPVTVISTRWKYDPRSFWELKRLIDRFQPNLIHAWTSDANVYGLAAAKAMGVKRFLAGYGCVDPFKSGPRLALDRCIGKHCIRLTANNAGVRDFYIRKGLPAEKFQIIPGGVEPSQTSTTTRRQLLAELHLPENSRLIGLVDSLFLRNRIKDAIWAADLLKVVRKDVHLLIIGDGPHREQLRRFRDQVRIADFVHFLGLRNDLPRLMPHFDMLWSTSPHEDQSSVILEAMAAGVAVVACDTPGTRDLVLHRETGYLVPIGDRTGLARHAYQLFEDQALFDRLGKAAAERARLEFPPEKMISRYADMYRQILG
jgi:glycosyltransferase involved in cell wall biosynthesis